MPYAYSMPFGKYSQLINGSGSDVLLGREIIVEKRVLGTTLVKGEYPSSLQDQTSPTMLSSRSDESQLLEDDSIQIRKRQIRAIRRPGAPKLELIDVSTCGSPANVLADAVQISANSETIEVLAGQSDTSDSFGDTPRHNEVLLDREQKRPNYFFPPSVRSEKASRIGSSRSETVPQEGNRRAESYSDAASLPYLDKSSPSTYSEAFHIGDRVDIIAGEHKGCTGTVVQTMGNCVHVFLDFKNETWSMPLECIQPYVFMPRQKVHDGGGCQGNMAFTSFFSSFPKKAKSNSRPPRCNVATRSSMTFKSRVSSEDGSFSTITTSSILFNNSTKKTLREGQLVEIIEGPQKDTVGKILRATEEVVQIFVDGAAQPWYFSPRAVRQHKNRFEC